MTDDAAAFARLVEALRPWLGELVVVGGWAHRLHRLVPGAARPAYAPLRTRDVDVAFGAGARLAGSVRAALADAGFREEPATDHVPPVTWYRLGAGDAFYAEFLTPLRGSGTRRDGTPDATLARGGVTAQKLRHLDLLLVAPTPVRLDPGGEVPVREAAEVRVPNAAAFLAQKLLIAPQRPAAKRAQDVLYIHDTLELFGTAADELRATWEGVLAPACGAAARRAIVLAARERFAVVTDEVRRAALIPPDRRLAPDRVRALCDYGLRAVFAADR